LECDGFGGVFGRGGSLEQPYAFTGREVDRLVVGEARTRLYYSSEARGEEASPPLRGGGRIEGEGAVVEDLYYYRARYYDPRAGRFLTKDPLGLAAGDVNLYRYVGNNPVNYRDPSGLVAAPWHWLISLAAGLSEGRSWSESRHLAWESMIRDWGTQRRIASDANVHGMVGFDPLLGTPQEAHEAIMNAMQIIAHEAKCGRHGSALHTVQDLEFFWHAGQEWKGWGHWTAIPHVILDIIPLRGLWNAYQASRQYLRTQVK